MGAVLPYVGLAGLATLVSERARTSWTMREGVKVLESRSTVQAKRTAACANAQRQRSTWRVQGMQRGWNRANEDEVERGGRRGTQGRPLSIVTPSCSKVDIEAALGVLHGGTAMDSARPQTPGNTQ